MLIFFAISGIWQTVDPHYDKDSKVLALLSTIHQSHGLKATHQDLSGPVMRWFVVAMSVGLMITSIIGIIMTLKIGRSPTATLACLGFGVLLPRSLPSHRFPTTDGRELLLVRRTEPDRDVALLLARLKLELPPQSPRRISQLKSN